MIVERVRGLLARYQDSLPMRVSRTMIAIGGYDRALALSSQAFGALVPMILLLSLTADDQSRAAAVVAGGLGLSASAADALTGLVTQPPPSTGLTVIGAVLLVVSVFGFIRSLQRTFAAIWNLPSSGVRGYWRSGLASVTLVVEFALLVLLAPVLGVLLGSVVLGLVVHTVAATLLWWPIQWVLLDGRVGWRRLLPGALITGLGQAVLVLASSIYLPIAVSHSTARLGVVGIAVALLSWLVFLGVLLVVSAVTGAELVQRPDKSEPEHVGEPVRAADDG